MEKETRDDIRDATQDARRLLEQDFAEQLQGDYDVMPDGRVGEKPGAHLIGRQKILRARIVAAIEHKKMAGMTPKEAVADYLRDTAFTTLNRFVALKMLEARELVQECITKGEASSGFVNEFCAFAPGVKLTKNDVLTAFIERAIGTSVPRGRIGAITSRTPFFLSSYERWREEIVLKKAPPVVFADLGAGVLDGAAVETAAYSLELI
jgi:hypothetical protein